MANETTPLLPQTEPRNDENRGEDEALQSSQEQQQQQQEDDVEQQRTALAATTGASAPEVRATTPSGGRRDTRSKFGKRFYTILPIILVLVFLQPFLAIVLDDDNFPWIWPGRWGKPKLNIEERVEYILSVTPLIDGHNDLPILVRMFYGNKIYDNDFSDRFDNGTLPGHVDLPRLRKGRFGGVFWSVFVECPKEDWDFKDTIYYKSVHDTLQQIDVIHRIVDKWSNHLGLAKIPNDVRRIHRKQGKIAGMLGVEGAHMLGNSIATLRLYYELGARYLTLTHNCNNKFADANVSPKGPYWHGLNPLEGVQLVHELNRLGMMVDLSHTSPATMRDALAVTKAPVIFSHSGAKSICPHPRNVPDDILDAVKKNGGIVMATFVPDFVYCGKDKDGKERNPLDAQLENVVEHIMHIGNRIGFEHVGIGTDFDGTLSLPKGLEDVSTLPKLFEELLRRNVTDAQARGIAGENLLRVWEEAEEVARVMRKEGKDWVFEDEIQGRLSIKKKTEL